jgi:hypothetical protein
MLPPNPADKLREAPVADLVSVLLRQFQRLLDKRGLTLSKADIDEYGQRVAARDALPETGSAVRAHLVELVNESLNELQTRFEITFAQSLTADMDDIGGWETTAEFLEIANHKSNAELRISAGAALLLFLGETRFVPHLFTVIDHDAGTNDVDAMFARRALSYHTQVDLDATNWRQQVRDAL